MRSPRQVAELRVVSVLVEQDEGSLCSIQGRFGEDENLRVPHINGVDRSFLVKDPIGSLQAVDSGNKVAEIPLGRLPILRPGVDHIEAAAKAMLKANGHQHPGGEQSREGIAQLDRLFVSAQLRGQTFGVVRFRETHGRRQRGSLTILIETPGFCKVPPL